MPQSKLRASVLGLPSLAALLGVGPLRWHGHTPDLPGPFPPVPDRCSKATAMPRPYLACHYPELALGIRSRKLQGREKKRKGKWKQKENEKGKREEQGRYPLHQGTAVWSARGHLVQTQDLARSQCPGAVTLVCPCASLFTSVCRRKDHSRTCHRGLGSFRPQAA